MDLPWNWRAVGCWNASVLRETMERSNCGSGRLIMQRVFRPRGENGEPLLRSNSRGGRRVGARTPTRGSPVGAVTRTVHAARGDDSRRGFQPWPALRLP